MMLPVLDTYHIFVKYGATLAHHTLGDEKLSILSIRPPHASKNLNRFADYTMIDHIRWNVDRKIWHEFKLQSVQCFSCMRRGMMKEAEQPL